jgi:hypothetical protein
MMLSTRSADHTCGKISSEAATPCGTARPRGGTRGKRSAGFLGHAAGAGNGDSGGRATAGRRSRRGRAAGRPQSASPARPPGLAVSTSVASAKARLPNICERGLKYSAGNSRADYPGRRAFAMSRKVIPPVRAAEVSGPRVAGAVGGCGTRAACPDGRMHAVPADRAIARGWPALTGAIGDC